MTQKIGGESVIHVAILMLCAPPQARPQNHDSDSRAIKAAIDTFTDA